MMKSTFSRILSDRYMVGCYSSWYIVDASFLDDVFLQRPADGVPLLRSSELLGAFVSHMSLLRSWFLLPSRAIYD
jgi:hypothetical protein